MQEKANLHNNQIRNDIFERVKQIIINDVDRIDPERIETHLTNIFNEEKQAALDEVRFSSFFLPKTDLTHFPKFYAV